MSLAKGPGFFLRMEEQAGMTQTNQCLCGECVGDRFDLFPCTLKPKPPAYPYPEEQEATLEDCDMLEVEGLE